MDLVSLYESAKNHLMVKYPSWNSELLNKAALAYTAIEGNLVSKIVKINKISSGLRQICESTGMQINESGVLSNILLEYYAPQPQIIERTIKQKEGQAEETVKIMTGTALRPTTSGNFLQYLKSEIIEAAPTLKGVPVQKDHSFSVNDTFGVVEKIILNESTGLLKYEARVDADDPITKKIEKKFVKASSVGYKPEYIECTICNEKISWFHEHVPGFQYEGKTAKGIPRKMNFNHLGTVLFPGVGGASAKIESGYDTMPESLDESMLMIMTAGFEPYYSQITESMKGGIQLSSDDEKIKTENYKALLDNEKLKLQNENLEKQMKEQQAKHDAFVKEQEAIRKATVIEQVMKSEIILEKLKEEDKSKREPDLQKLSTEHLSARLVALDEQIEMMGDKLSSTGKTTKSKVFGEDRTEQILNTGQLTGRQLREMQCEWLGAKMFGKNYKPSSSAVQTLDDWDMVKGEWKFPLKELLV